MNKRIEMKSFTLHLDERYGKIGTKKEMSSKGNPVRLSSAKCSGMPADVPRYPRTSSPEDPERKPRYISRLENGKIDVQISTLFRILENGLGRTVELAFK